VLREMKAYNTFDVREERKLTNEKQQSMPLSRRAALDIRFRGSVLTKLSRDASFDLLLADEFIRKAKIEREREVRAMRITVPRDRAFNYYTARTNLRASGRRCRMPEKQFRERQYTMYNGGELHRFRHSVRSEEFLADLSALFGN